MKKTQGFAALIGLCLSSQLPAQIIPNSANWTGGSGNWSQANWIYAEPLTPTVPPLPIPYPDVIYGFAFICDIGGSSVNVSIPITIADMEVDNGGRLSIQNVPFAIDALTVAGGTLRNDGSVVISGGGSLRGTLALPLFISGDGNIVLQNDASRLGEIGFVDNGGNRISGDGAIVGAGFNNDNGGVVTSDRLGDSLTIEAILVDNDGVFSATNGGRVLVDPIAFGELNNTGSRVEALDGGSVEISDTKMSGGTGQARRTGIISFNDAEIDGVALTADDLSSIRFSGNSRLINDNGIRLTHDSVGELFENSTITGGLLQADMTSGFLTTGAPTLAGTTTLDGKLTVQSGLLGLAGLDLDNSLGLITVSAGTEMRTAGVNTIQGGAIAGAGRLTMTGTTSLGPGATPLVISEVAGSVGPSADLILLGDIQNDTVIEIDASDLLIDADLEIDGDGSIVFDGAFPGSALHPVAEKDPLLTVGIEQTLTTRDGARGEVTTRVHNFGRIESSGAGSLMFYRRDLRNEGHFGARDGGAYELSPGLTLDNVGGTIFTERSGTVRDANGLTVVGGSFAGDNTGQFNVQALALLDAVGPDPANPVGMTTEPGAVIDVSRRGGSPVLRLNGTLFNNGTIQIRDLLGTDPTRAAFEPVGIATVEGRGQIVFPIGNTNLLRPGPSGERFIIGPEQTVRTDGPSASGLIQVPITNFGLFEARGGVLRIQEDMISAGVLRSLSGGILRLEGVTIDQTSAGPGLVEVQPGGTTQISMSQLIGGRIGGGENGSVSIVDEALLDAVGPNPARPVGFVIDPAATLDVSLSGGDPTLNVKGGITLNGTILLRDFIGTDGAEASIAAIGDTSFIGSGEILFGSGDQQWIEAGEPGSTLFLGPELTVRTTPGSKGRILLPVINDGLIDARSGTINIQENIVNNGVIAATEVGSLLLQSLRIDSTSGGLLQVDASSVFDLESCDLTSASFAGDGTLRLGGANTLNASPPETARVFPNTTVHIGRFGSASLELTGTLRVDGVLHLRAPRAFSPAQSDLIINGHGILAGEGVTKMGFSDQSRLGQTIRPLVETDSLTIQREHSVRTNGASSSGTILLDTINQGELQAAGGTLSILGENGILNRPLALTNNGQITSTNSGRLALNHVNLDQNGGGVVSVETGSSAIFDRNVTVHGGKFSGGGVYIIGTPFHVFDTPLIDEQAEFRLGNDRSSSLILHSDLILNGRMDLTGVDGFSGFIPADIVVDGERSIQTSSPNGGLITFSGSAPVDFRPDGPLDPNDRLILSEGVTVRSDPQSNLLLLVPTENHGVLDLDRSAVSAQVSPQTNRGTISLRNGSVLDVRSDIVIDNHLGVIEVDGGSLIKLGPDSVLSAGVFSGEGRIESTSRATIAPGSRLATQWIDVSSGILKVSEQFTNDGPIRLLGRRGFAGGIFCSLELTADTRVDGHGSIEGASDRFNTIRGATGLSPAPILTLGPDQSLLTAPGHALQCATPITCEGSVVAGGDISFSSDCRITESGIVTGAGILRMTSAPALEVQGTIQPGAPTGVLSIFGKLELGGTSVTEIEIGGAGPGQSDSIHVSGDTKVNGILKAQLVNGYTPTIGETFTILAAAGVTGRFHSLEIDAAGARRAFELSYTPNSVILTAIAKNYTNYDDWAQDQFSAADQADPPISGKDADPDGDGLNNFREYVHALPPKTPNDDPFKAIGSDLNGEPPVRSVDTRFPWADGMIDADFRIERSINLLEWLPATSSIQLETDLGAYRRLTVRTSFPLPAPNTGFLRLRILRIP